MYEYASVILPRQGTLRSMDQQLQHTLSLWSTQGWRLHTASLGYTFMKYEVLLVFEREVRSATD